MCRLQGTATLRSYRSRLIQPCKFQLGKAEGFPMRPCSGTSLMFDCSVSLAYAKTLSVNYTSLSGAFLQRIWKYLVK